jgi:hypothetical protein
MRSRSRTWCFPINNPNENDLAAVQTLQINERITHAYCGFEIGEQGTPHLQGFLRSANQIDMRTVENMLGGRARLARARGTTADNKRYCLKDGHIILGKGILEEPHSNSKKEDYQQLREAIIGGDSIPILWSKFPRIFITHGARIERLSFEYQKAEEAWPGDLAVKNIWIWGPTGTGKSRWAHTQALTEEIFDKNPNKWWDGYREATKVVIIEDLDPTTPRKLANHLKKWTDRYTFTAEIKGGAGE